MKAPTWVRAESHGATVAPRRRQAGAELWCRSSGAQPRAACHAPCKDKALMTDHSGVFVRVIRLVHATTLSVGLCKS